jgi:hypothetical protein
VRRPPRKPQQQVGAAVERRCPVSDRQRGGVGVDGAQLAGARAEKAGREAARAERRVDAASIWMASGTRRRMPSVSGVALRNPDAPAAVVNVGKAADGAGGREHRPFPV